MKSYYKYLHEQAVKVADEFRSVEAKLMELLQKIDGHRVYRRLGYASLYAYATKALGLTEAVAYGFIQVARKAKQMPELKAAINQGEISVSKAQRVVSVLTPENQERLLTMAKTLPKREIEKEVARISPRQAVGERARYVSEHLLELKLGVSPKLMGRLHRAKDLCSTRQQRPVRLEETLDDMSGEYIDRHDPVARAMRAQERTRRREEKKAENDKAPTAGSAEPSSPLAKVSPTPLPIANNPSPSQKMAAGKPAVAANIIDAPTPRNPKQIDVQLCPGRVDKLAALESLSSGGLAADRSTVAELKQATGETDSRKKERKRLPTATSGGGLNKQVLPAGSTSVTQTAAASTIPAAVKHMVTLRDGGQCSFVGSGGERCRNRRWLQFHHLRPRSQGGRNDPNNLTLLCRDHHRGTHSCTDF